MKGKEKRQERLGVEAPQISRRSARARLPFICDRYKTNKKQLPPPSPGPSRLAEPTLRLGRYKAVEANAASSESAADAADKHPYLLFAKRRPARSRSKHPPRAVSRRAASLFSPLLLREKKGISWMLKKLLLVKSREAQNPLSCIPTKTKSPRCKWKYPMSNLMLARIL